MEIFSHGQRMLTMRSYIKRLQNISIRLAFDS